MKRFVFPVILIFFFSLLQESVFANGNPRLGFPELEWNLCRLNGRFSFYAQGYPATLEQDSSGMILSGDARRQFLGSYEKLDRAGWELERKEPGALLGEYLNSAKAEKKARLLYVHDSTLNGLKGWTYCLHLKETASGKPDSLWTETGFAFIEEGYLYFIQVNEALEHRNSALRAYVFSSLLKVEPEPDEKENGESEPSARPRMWALLLLLPVFITWIVLRRKMKRKKH